MPLRLVTKSVWIDWELVENSTGTVTIAVIDTGVDLTHPWFEGRIVAPFDAAKMIIILRIFWPRDSYSRDYCPEYTFKCQAHACQGV